MRVETDAARGRGAGRRRDRERAHVRGRGSPLRDRAHERPARGVRRPRRTRSRSTASVARAGQPVPAQRTAHPQRGRPARSCSALPDRVSARPAVHSPPRRARLRPRGRRAGDSAADGGVRPGRVAAHGPPARGPGVRRRGVAPTRPSSSRLPATRAWGRASRSRISRSTRGCTFEAWSDPPIRWLLSTVPSAMIFDDHDVVDDWNTSAAWVDEMRRQDWWNWRGGRVHGLRALPALGQPEPGHARAGPGLPACARGGRRRQDPGRGRIQVDREVSGGCAELLPRHRHRRGS